MQKRYKKTSFCRYVVIDNYCCHDNDRIWVVCNPSTVYVIPIHKDAQYVHCLIKHYATNKEFHSTFVYGYNSAVQRMLLWDSLVLLSNQVTTWIVLGEFNATRDNDEQLSKNLANEVDMKDFNPCFLQMGLDDFKSLACKFTLTN